MKIAVFGEVINLKKITTGDKFMVDKNEDSAPESDESEVTIFDKKIESVSDNELDFRSKEPPVLNAKLGVFERLLNRVERLVVVLFHKIFDEVEAATYLRLPDPEHQGRDRSKIPMVFSYFMSPESFKEAKCLIERPKVDHEGKSEVEDADKAAASTKSKRNLSGQRMKEKAFLNGSREESISSSQSSQRD